MQQIVCLCQEPESTEWLEAELPLALRLRRSWSCGDIWDLRRASEDDFVSYPDSTSPVGTKLSNFGKFIDDDASTCADDGVSSISDETSIGECVGLASPSLDWAEEMWAFDATKGLETPSGIQAMPSGSVAIPFEQWAASKTPQSVVSTHSRNRCHARKSGKASVSASLATIQCPKVDLVKSVKNIQRSDPEAWFQYTNVYGENTRDPSKHTAQFLVDFLRQHNDGIPAASAGRVAVPPGTLHAPVGKTCAPPGNWTA
jgi:hypothetical protein